MPSGSHQNRRSADLSRRASARTPGGVHSSVRMSGPRPFISRAKGAWLYGVDGDSYVDYLLGQGPNFLGHAPDALVNAVTSAIRRGLIYGGQHELEVEAAEAVCQALEWPAMVRFAGSGTEAVQVALRLARAATGRRTVVRFEGHYHGWLDNVLVAPDGDGVWGAASAGQLDGDLDHFTIVPWNRPDVVEEVFRDHGDQIAAVVMEPIMVNAGVIQPRAGYLEHVRRLCTENGAVLIFDEIISGFRFGLGGAVERYGVVPDLATYGKALAGGWPVAAVAGRVELMELLNGQVIHAGTFNSSVAGMAAVKATVARLRQDPPYEAIEEHGAALMRGIQDIADANHLSVRLQGLPMAFHMSFGAAEVTDYRSLQELDLGLYADFAEALIHHGVWVAGRGVWYVSASHGDEELEAALTRISKTVSDWI
ncbi:aspartate aminotransferase family protein [Phytoactinopolyspora limicola]|uniref:aspartate aminotransferase family protein n=1 Tax=Phytoactinopolyspora limicola TaxID=2715536 RepID=UPI00140E49ED|nr:aspartate aminotransferase family protein [Phytoactinopolyspora limicola]